VTEYSIVTLRNVGESDGRLFPVVTAEPAIALEPWDGDPLRLAGRALSVYEPVPGGWRTRARVRRTTFDLMITDSRFVVLCGKRRNRLGLPVLSPRAARRAIEPAADETSGQAAERATVLAGHVRYPWLRCVGFKSGVGRQAREVIRLGVTARAHDGSARELYLDVDLPTIVDARAVARAIIRRAAAHRLDFADIVEREHREYLALLTRAPTSRLADRDKFALCSLPQSGFVSADSAYPPPGSRGT
jgi:hypothetical protein